MSSWRFIWTATACRLIESMNSKPTPASRIAGTLSSRRSNLAPTGSRQCLNCCRITFFLSRDRCRFVWVRPSRNPGVLSTLQYTIMIYEAASSVSEEESSLLSVLIVTLLAVAGGAAVFWKYGRGQPDTAADEIKKENGNRFRWLREEGSDLIPLNEIASRKQYAGRSWRTVSSGTRLLTLAHAGKLLKMEWR